MFVRCIFPRSSQFKRSNKLKSIRVAYFSQITASSTVHYSSAVKLEATRLSFAEVVCSLHEVTVRSKRNVKQTAKDTFIARGYDVSISNDGVHFSVADSIIIFDSTCVNCTKVGKNIFCVKDVSIYSQCMNNLKQMLIESI